MKGITKKQKDLLTFIREFIETHHYSPSLKEIQNHFGYRSIATVHQHIVALKNKGRLSFDRRSSRSLQLIIPPSDLIMVPIVGELAASHPIEFFTSIEEHVPIAKSALQRPDQSYFLRVRGDGYAHEHILSQDLLLIEATQTLSQGDIGLFILSSGATLLRRYFPQDEFVRLEPINLTSYSPHETFRIHEVSIKGRLLTTTRNY